MKLLILLVLGLAVSIRGEALNDDTSAFSDEPVTADDFEAIDEDLGEDDLDALADPDEVEAMEEADVPDNDPYVVQSIKYYCRFCKICSACKRNRRCSGKYMRIACSQCKYCNPKTYWNLVRRIRIRIPRIRVPRIRVPRVRWGRRRRRWG